MSRRGRRRKISRGDVSHHEGPGPRRRWRALLFGVTVVAVVGGLGWRWWTESGRVAPPAVTMPDLTVLGTELRTLLAEPEAYLRQHPTDPEAYGKLGRALHAEEEFDAARQCYENARRLDSENPVWWYYLAQLDAQNVRRAEAIAKYRRVTELKPDYPFAHLHLGEQCLEAGELDAAETAFRRFVQLAPREPGGWIGLGRVFRSRGRLATAEEHLERAVALAPDDGQAHYHLGVVLRDLGRPDAARKHLDLSQQLGSPLPPFDPLMAQVTAAGVSYKILINRAKQADRTGHTDEAVEIAKRLLDLRPDEPFVHYFYGSLCIKVGDLATAEKCLRRAIDLRPDHADAMVLLAGVLRKSGRMEEGRQWHERAVAIRPNDAGVHHNLAVGLVRVGRYEEAVASLRRAAALEPENPARHRRLAEALSRIGRTKEAAEAYRAAERAADKAR